MPRPFVQMPTDAHARALKLCLRATRTSRITSTRADACTRALGARATECKGNGARTCVSMCSSCSLRRPS
eukprot:7823642-Alexandrium_andersonii.AAC.1